MKPEIENQKCSAKNARHSQPNWLFPLWIWRKEATLDARGAVMPSTMTIIERCEARIELMKKISTDSHEKITRCLMWARVNKKKGCKDEVRAWVREARSWSRRAAHARRRAALIDLELQSALADQRERSTANG